MNKLEVVARPETVIGEGPHWVADEQALYYVDILGNRVLRYDAKTGKNAAIKVRLSHIEIPLDIDLRTRADQKIQYIVRQFQ